MKTTLFFIFFMCMQVTTKAQWEPDVRLTFDPHTSTTGYSPGAHSIASSSDTIHVVWADDRDGNFEIYYKRSTDRGLTWGTDIRITNQGIVADSPAIAVSGSSVHIVWRDYRDLNAKLYYIRSSDGGNCWDTISQLTNSLHCFNPSLTVSGSFVHMVYYEYSDQKGEIYYMRSTDAGLTWEPETRLTNDPAFSMYPSIAASGPDLHVAWFDRRDGNLEIYYKRSEDAGINWGPDTRLTNNDFYSNYPCIGVYESNIHLLFMDNRSGNYEIYYKNSVDGGINWNSEYCLSDNTGVSRFSNLAVSGQELFAVWANDRDGNDDIYFRHSLDGGLNWFPEVRLTNDPAKSNQPNISVSGSQINVVWFDARDGNNEIYYKRDPTGVLNVGIDEKPVNNPSSLFNVFPNPASDKIQINFKIESKESTFLIIRNMLGEEIVNIQIKNGDTGIDVSIFNNGIYCLNFYENETLRGTAKLVISK